MTDVDAAWPTEIAVRDGGRTLAVAFEDGAAFELPAEYLRVESPSAEVQGHGPGQRKWVAGKLGINLEAVEPIGHYAVRIRFTDGHDSGIYTWALLHDLAREQAQRWQAYLEALAIQGLSRDPAARPAPRSRSGAPR